MPGESPAVTVVAVWGCWGWGCWRHRTTAVPKSGEVMQGLPVKHAVGTEQCSQKSFHKPKKQLDEQRPVRMSTKAPGRPTYCSKTLQSLAKRSVNVTSWYVILIEVLVRGSVTMCLRQLIQCVIMSPFDALAFPPNVRFLLN